MRIIVAGDVAGAAAEIIANALRERLADADRASLALSGGKTPWGALNALAATDLDWERVDAFQVDERIAPAGDPARNAVGLDEALLSRVPITPYLMPVERADLPDAAAAYATALPETLDVVQLGLGSDGHTASLLPGDPALDITTEDVALTGAYQGNRRMTLTYPAINRARLILWIVSGAEKHAATEALVRGDAAIPAGRVRRTDAILVVDRSALGEIA